VFLFAADDKDKKAQNSIIERKPFHKSSSFKDADISGDMLMLQIIEEGGDDDKESEIYTPTRIRDSRL
jgi:hypothetical protein